MECKVCRTLKIIDKYGNCIKNELRSETSTTFEYEKLLKFKSTPEDGLVLCILTISTMRIVPYSGNVFWCVFGKAGYILTSRVSGGTA